MDWLAQNWVNLLLLVGVIFFLRFGCMGCGRGRHQHSTSTHAPQNESIVTTESGPPIDPVSRQVVDTASPITAVYQGRTFYFASRANRDQFEKAPHRYVTTPAGHHHGGCC